MKKKNLQYFVYARDDHYWFSLHEILEGTTNSIRLYRRRYGTIEEATAAAKQAITHEYAKYGMVYNDEA